LIALHGVLNFDGDVSGVFAWVFDVACGVNHIGIALGWPPVSAPKDGHFGGMNWSFHVLLQLFFRLVSFGFELGGNFFACVVRLLCYPKFYAHSSVKFGLFVLRLWLVLYAFVENKLDKILVFVVAAFQ
jgi:hypothetical protein